MARSNVSIGDRFMHPDGESHYVVVGWTGDVPLLTGWEPGDPIDYEFMDTVSMEHMGRTPTPAPDAEISAAVVGVFQEYQRKIQAEHAALTPLEQVIFYGSYQWQQTVRDAVADFQRANQVWEERKADLDTAAHARAKEMKYVDLLMSTQEATAKALGISQSRVSRTLAGLDRKAR